MIRAKVGERTPVILTVTVTPEKQIVLNVIHNEHSVLDFKLSQPDAAMLEGALAMTLETLKGGGDGSSTGRN